MASDGLFWEGEGTPIDLPEPPAKPIREMIPVILVPGIMGSNIIVRGDKEEEVRRRFAEEGREAEFTKNAWDAPNFTNFDFIKECIGMDSGVVKTSKQWEGYGPKFRQLMLNPRTTEVSLEGYIPENLGKIEGRNGREVAKERGWGSVHWDSYGSFLQLFQKHLNPVPDIPELDEL